MASPRLDTSLETLLARLAATQEPAALATIVSTVGSTYRKAGARMLIERDGRITGLLSGGCLESDLAERAHRVITSQHPEIIEYDMRTEDDLIFGIGAGCEGAMRILIEPLPVNGTLATALLTACRVSQRGEAVAIAVVHRGDPQLLGTRVYRTGDRDNLPAALARMCGSVLDTATSRSFVHEADRDGFEAWIQYLAAVPEVLICGAGPDAVPLADLLATLGFPVTVTDHRPAYVSAQRFPAATLGIGPADTIASRLDLDRFSAAVVMSHHLASDTHYLRALASSRVPYVGALGPRKRRERLMKDLGSAAGALGARLRGPVGLDIGAITPEAIALAIAAEIHAFAAGRAGETHSRTSTN